MKWLVTLSGEKTWEYRTYATPPYRELANAAARDLEHTVKAAPTSISPKLNVCCVVLAAFSLAVKSPQATLPSSLKAVTAFLLGLGDAPVVPRPVWVAYNRVPRRGCRGVGKLKRQLVLLMDIILSQNAWSNQLQASKLLILKPLDSFVKLGFGQKLR